MKLYYIAMSLGATIRGMAILKGLGLGTLVSPWREIAKFEGIKVHGGIPTKGVDVYIWDKYGPNIPRRKGEHICIDKEMEGAALTIPLNKPIVGFEIDKLSKEKAEEWWKTPYRVRTKLGKGFEFPPVTGERILSTRRNFELEQSLQGRCLYFGLKNFYWPAPEIMSVADIVMGGRQTMMELDVLEGKAADDGLDHAIFKIKEFLGV